VAGISKRAGYDRKWGFLLNLKIEDKKDSGLKHEVESNLELVGSLGSQVRDNSLNLDLNSSDSQKVIDKFGLGSDFVAIHPFTSDSIKQWPLKNFAELIQAIKEKTKVVVVGAKQEASQLREFVGLDQAVDLIGKTSLIELAHILSKAKLLISGDSGPVHLAAAVSTKVIAIFRSDIIGKSAKRWGPWGEGHCVIAKDKLEDISVKEVLGKIYEKEKEEKLFT